ncbi:MAG TPA: hypothetical protein VM778_00285 [Gemmatimonadota bacterium]|nr:hypothetical protein [Gemmatimonadota bacterium]
MSLIRVWKERKRVSPHQPKRAHTVLLTVGLALVFLAIWIVGRLA